MLPDHPSRYVPVHPEKSNDQRTAGQRDRDRILYTSAFRRLAQVTQVVSSGEGHIFHNRMTHTLEVAQVARRFAEHFVAQEVEKIAKYGKKDVGYFVNPDIVEAASLAHDLGHPPFGHCAEEELNSLLQVNQQGDGFEGNAQSFRIVTKLASRRGIFRGLNLCLATLNAILKYPWPHGESPPIRKQKWGFYSSERVDFDKARALIKRNKEYRTVEAEIMDWADDVAYSVHDMEDFYRAGMIPLDRLCRSPEELELFLEGVIIRREAAKRPLGFSKEQARSAFKRILGENPAHLYELTRPYSGSHFDRSRLRAFTSSLIDRYIRGKDPETKAKNRKAPFTLREPDSENRIKRDVPMDHEVKILKELVSHYVFNDPSLVEQQHGQRGWLERSLIST